MVKKITGAKLFVIVLVLILSILVSMTSLSGSAITVVKDGKEYTLHVKTPTEGDCNVLMIRLGFADYPLDDEDYPADSEETLLSYFDGSPDSINGYYETSSYGKLRLHCDKIYSYTAPYDRSEYDDDFEIIISEALDAVGDDIDADKYDSNGDGNIDFICFDFSGPVTQNLITWWPHVSYDGNTDFKNKKIAAYSVLKSLDPGDPTVFKHEFGHILGATDYYSEQGIMSNAIMSYDIMCTNIGDHNGFTKWSYGWINDDNITYVDKNTGDTTVTLTPFETTDGGKKIAVVSPEINRSNGFLDEYFLVEYDTGEGNNSKVFDDFSLEPGFRIFHVNAKADFRDDYYINIIKSNENYRDNLIHNMKNELDRPTPWNMDNNLFHEGDSLTPDTYPNTGLEKDGIYNGRFTGISFTDFVTGDNPSFKVSFTDDYKPDTDVNFSLSYNDLSSDMKMTLVSDKPVILDQNNNNASPYLLDDKGNQLSLNITGKGNILYTYELKYLMAYPSIRPNTEYTLVIPEGCFKYGYDQTVPEYRETIKTSDFFALTTIDAAKLKDRMVLSNIFKVTDSSYGAMYITSDNSGGSCIFNEYNLNGEEISSIEFDAPETDGYIYKFNVIPLNDGNYSLELTTTENDYFVKIDRSGKILSDIYTISSELQEQYKDQTYSVGFIPIRNGIGKAVYNSEKRINAFITVDYENPPEITEMERFSQYYSLSRDTYVNIYSDGSNYYMYVYDSDGNIQSEIVFEENFNGVFEENGNISIIKCGYTRKKEEYAFVDTYSKSGEFLDRKDITEKNSQISGYPVFSRCVSTDNSYYLESYQTNSKIVLTLDKDWNYIGRFELPEFTKLTYVGICGLTQQTDNIADIGFADVISRFSIGEPDIVPKEEESSEQSEEPSETSEESSEPSKEPSEESSGSSEESKKSDTSSSSPEKSEPGSSEKSTVSGSSAVASSQNNSIITNSGSPVQTGDNNFAVILLVTIIASGGIVFILLYRRKV